jgi:hypothetical protein
VTSDAEHPIESAVEPAATAPPPASAAMATGVQNRARGWRAHRTRRGLLGIPRTRYCAGMAIVAAGGLGGTGIVRAAGRGDRLPGRPGCGSGLGALLAVYRDVTASGAAKPDRRFAVAWGILSAGLIFLWLGWVAFYVFPSTAFGTLRYTLTLLAGAVAALLLSAGCVGR